MEEKKEFSTLPKGFVSEKLTEGEIEEIDELEDFDTKEAVYQVWLLGYDAEDRITDFSLCVYQGKELTDALDYADRIINEEISYETECFEEFPENAYITLEVETVVTDEDGNEENIESVFEKLIYKREQE